MMLLPQIFVFFCFLGSFGLDSGVESLLIKEWDANGGHVAISREEAGYLVEIKLKKEGDSQDWDRYFNVSDQKRLKKLGIGPDEYSLRKNLKVSLVQK